MDRAIADRFHHRLSRLEETMRRSQTAPTFPKYDISIAPATKILQARCLSTDPGQAYAVALLGTGSINITNAIWFSYDIAFSIDYITFLTAHYSEDQCVNTLSSAGAGQEYMGINAPNAPAGPMKWMISNSTQFTIGGPVVGGTWYHVDWMTQASSAGGAFFINGVDQGITHNSFVRSAAKASFGVPNYSLSGQDVFIYYKDIKIGTAMGTSDLFDGTGLSSTTWPFSNPSAPTVQLSVIDSPF